MTVGVVTRAVILLSNRNIFNRPFCSKFVFQIFIPISWICAGILNIPLFLIAYFDEDTKFCREYWPDLWLPRAYSLTWFFVGGIIPVTLMIVLYSKVVYRLWFKRQENGYPDVARQVCPAFFLSFNPNVCLHIIVFKFQSMVILQKGGATTTEFGPSMASVCK